MKRIAILFFVVFLFSFFGSSLQNINAKILNENTFYILKGKVNRIETVSYVDQSHVTRYILVPDKPLKIKCVDGEVRETDRFEFFTNSKSMRKTIESMVDKNVEVSGEIFEPGSSYYSCIFAFEPKEFKSNKSITSKMLSLEKNKFVFSKKKIKPRIIVKYKNKCLTEGINYKVSYSNNYWAGNGVAKVNGIGDYSGSAIIKFKIQYNGKLAAEYALDHYNNYNTEKYKTIDNDCTNFVSQCLYNGGLRMIFPSKISYIKNKFLITKKYWYMKKRLNLFSWSSTWSCVTRNSLGQDKKYIGYGLKEHLINYRFAKESNTKYNKYCIDRLIKECNVGDILQCKFYGSKYETHSLLISEKTKENGKYNISICYHTNDKHLDFRNEAFDKDDKGRDIYFGNRDTFTLIKMSDAH